MGENPIREYPTPFHVSSSGRATWLLVHPISRPLHAGRVTKGHRPLSIMRIAELFTRAVAPVARPVCKGERPKGRKAEKRFFPHEGFPVAAIAARTSSVLQA